MEALGGRRDIAPTHSLDGGEWSVSRPGGALPGERAPGTHWTRGWVGPRAGPDTEATGKILSPLPQIETPSSGRPVRCQSYPAQQLLS
jgi:hypothetical protein